MPDTGGVKAYQENHTRNQAAKKSMYDDQGRSRKAANVISVLEGFLGELSGFDLLDASCSTGIMAFEYSQNTGSVKGIDIDRSAVRFAADK